MTRAFLTRRFLAMLGVMLAIANSASGQRTVRRYTHVAISPDGNRVAWIGPPAAPSNLEHVLFISDLSRIRDFPRLY